MNKIKLEYFKPFGPGILKGKMPEKVLESFIKLSDEVIDKKRKKWNQALVGVIDDEWKIPELLYKDFNIDLFIDKIFYSYAECYVGEHLKWGKNKNESVSDYTIRVKRGDGWINYMKELEYNPVHIHTHCSLSSIFYINDYVGDSPISSKDTSAYDKANLDGHTTFIYGSNPAGEHKPPPSMRGEMGSHLTNFISKSHIDIKPSAGDFYVFPTWLLHSVYPFRGKGERITASINYGVLITFNKKENLK
tara:strand:+ start:45 stop:788 length:744 start_codon:yes stop_codon:yes gene_type:complete